MIAEKVCERLLFFLCRHCSEWRGIWRLKLPERVGAFRFARPGNFVTRTRYGCPIEVRRNDVVGHALHFYGCLNAPLEAIAAEVLQPGDVALDLGANIRGVALFLAKLVGPEGRVYAVEPMSANMELLARNVRRAGFEKILRTEHRAAGRDNLRQRLFFDADTSNWGAMSLHDHAGSGSEEIEIEPLDAMWARWGHPQIAFVKMDVEGFESDVLAGARKMMSLAPPRVWVVEFNPEYFAHMVGGAAHLWDEFVSRGYHPFTKTGKPVTEPPSTHCDVVFRLDDKFRGVTRDGLR